MKSSEEAAHQGSYDAGVMDSHGRVSGKNGVGYGSGVRAVIFIQENDYACYVRKQLQQFR